MHPNTHWVRACTMRRASHNIVHAERQKITRSGHHSQQHGGRITWVTQITCQPRQRHTLCGGALSIKPTVACCVRNRDIGVGARLHLCQTRSSVDQVDDSKVSPKPRGANERDAGKYGVTLCSLTSAETTFSNVNHQDGLKHASVRSCFAGGQTGRHATIWTKWLDGTNFSCCL